MNHGPTLPISEETGRDKHRQPGETFEGAMRRIADALSDSPEHAEALYQILLNRRFLPAGRVQSAAGSFRSTTAFNCFVSGSIPDSMTGIMDRLKEAALTMQKGGGIGYDFSTIRFRGAEIKSLGSKASGPLSFMEPFDATCGTVASAGNRRGAQMGVLRVDHPDILDFVRAKQDNTTLRRFNISVGITDTFMHAVMNDTDFDLKFNGEVVKTIRAVELWDEIMQATWDWAEPGVLFLDTINKMNNLWYCETIAAPTPCGEQPLPPHGACLLGSFNWAAYIVRREDGSFRFNMHQLMLDIPHVVRAMDNVIDRTIYPLPEQEKEAKDKRRMGLGAAGVANALEALGYPYGTDDAVQFVEETMEAFTNACYMASVDLAREKGAFPLYDETMYVNSKFIQKLDPWVQDAIRRWGIRNSHLTSIAPTGSIALAADNISSGIEPPFLLEYDRTVQQFDGAKVERVTDYAYREWGIEGRTAADLAPAEHVDMLIAFQKWVDSACSKTCNIGDDVTFEEFKDVYMKAWLGGAKGCTTFRSAGKRFGILNAIEETKKPSIWSKIKGWYAAAITAVVITYADLKNPFDVSDRICEMYGVDPETGDPLPDDEPWDEGAACTFDPATGKRTCE
jgi:ribonucleoside-diphosphate reductase alpha chain